MGKRINYVTRDMLSRLSKRLFRRCQLLEKWMLSWKKRAEELEADLNKYDELGCAMSKRFVDVYKNNLELWKLNQALPCLLYTSPSPRDGLLSRMPSSA